MKLSEIIDEIINIKIDQVLETRLSTGGVRCGDNRPTQLEILNLQLDEWCNKCNQ